MEEAFTVKTPEIYYLKPKSGSAGEEITIKGRFFGTSRLLVGGELHLGDRRILIREWTMDPKTGQSKIVFKVPLLLAPGDYYVTVSNKVGSDKVVDGFTVE